jgi:hypothetical protein
MKRKGIEWVDLRPSFRQSMRATAHRGDVQARLLNKSKRKEKDKIYDE